LESIITKQQAQEYRARWEAVAAIEQQEQRAASISQRLQQLNAIWRLAKGLGLQLENEKREKEVEIVRQRWARLKGIEE